MIWVLRLTLSITIVFERIMLRDIRAIQMWQAQEHLRIQRRRQLRTHGNSYTDRNVAAHYSRSHDAVIRVYDKAGNVIETHQHAGDFKER